MRAMLLFDVFGGLVMKFQGNRMGMHMQTKNNGITMLPPKTNVKGIFLSNRFLSVLV